MEFSFVLIYAFFQFALISLLYITAKLSNQAVAKGYASPNTGVTRKEFIQALMFSCIPLGNVAILAGTLIVLMSTLYTLITSSKNMNDLF